MTESPPDWACEADRVLAIAARRVTTITSATPTNWGAEATRLIEAWSRGHESAPSFAYGSRPELDDVVRAVETLGDALEARGPLGRLYADRARELAIEAKITASVGTPACASVVRERYGARDPHAEEADRLAHAWSDEPFEVDDDLVRSDDASDPRSLLSRARAGVGARRLAVRVVVVKNLAPLAAVGEGVLQIAEGRMTSSRAAERTAMHEIDGHLVPQRRASCEPLGLFAIGTRRGSDDQEGRALSLERRGAFLVGRRRAELGRRHLAAAAVLDGAHFVETVRLVRTLGADVPEAVRASLRAHRGAHEGRGGLAREIVYLPAMLRVEAVLRDDPTIEDVLSRGRVAVEAAATLRPFVAG